MENGSTDHFPNLVAIPKDSDGQSKPTISMADLMEHLASNNERINVPEREHQLTTAAHTMLSARQKILTSSLNRQQAADDRIVRPATACHDPCTSVSQAGLGSEQTTSLSLADAIQQLNKQMYRVSQSHNDMNARLAGLEATQQYFVVEFRSELSANRIACEEFRSLEHRLRGTLDKHCALQNERVDQLQNIVSKQWRVQRAASNEHQDSVITASKQDEQTDSVIAVERQLAEDHHRAISAIENIQHDLARTKASAFAETERLDQSIATLASIGSLADATNAQFQRHLAEQNTIWEQRTRDREMCSNNQLEQHRQEMDEQFKGLCQWIDRQLKQAATVCNARSIEGSGKIETQIEVHIESNDKQIQDLAAAVSKLDNGFAQVLSAESSMECSHSYQHEIQGLKDQIRSLIAQHNLPVEEEATGLVALRQDLCVFQAQQDTKHDDVTSKVLELRADATRMNQTVNGIGSSQAELKTRLIELQDSSGLATKDIFDRVETAGSKLVEHENALQQVHDRLQRFDEQLRDHSLSSTADRQRVDHLETYTMSSIQALLGLQVDSRRILGSFGKGLMKSIAPVNAKSNRTAQRMTKWEEDLRLHGSKLSSVERQVKKLRKDNRLLLLSMAKIDGMLDQAAHDAGRREELWADSMLNLQHDCADARDAFNDVLARSETARVDQPGNQVATSGSTRDGHRTSSSGPDKKREAVAVDIVEEAVVRDQGETRRKRKRKRKTVAARAAEHEYGGWR